MDVIAERKSNLEMEFEELVAEHGDIFLRDSDDYGRTNILYHRVGTGEAQPIRKTPRSFDLAKRAVVSWMLKKMQ
jgi:hypothetical protein